MKLQNGSQVAERPTPDTTSGSPGYFSTSNDKGEPSYPGKDWFNNIIDELLNGINAAGITYDSSKLTNLASAMAAVRDASNLNAGTIPLERLPTGAGKKLDADLLDGEEGSFYQNASNLKSGTVPLVRLPVTIASADQIKEGTSNSAVVTPQGLTESGVFADYTASVHWFATQISPAGFIKANGATLLIADYPELFAKLGTTFGGDGITSFAIPDIRGEFIRGWDDGRGVDAGRVFGSRQTDLSKSHNHDFLYGIRNNGDNGGFGGSYFGTPIGIRGTNGLNSNGTSTTTIEAEGGSETRPRNIALIAYIKY